MEQKVERDIPLSPIAIVRMYSAGMVVGLANAALFHPIDALRIRFFFQKKQLGSSGSFLNGFGFNILSTAVKQMATFPTQEVLKRYFQRVGYDNSLSQFFASLFSGLGLGVVAAPINTIKVPLQASTGASGRLTVFSVVRDINDKHGIQGFWRGGLGILLRDTSWCCVYFPLYAHLKKRLLRHYKYRYSTPNSTISKSEHVGLNLVGSIAASSVAMLISYPFDGARLYRQTLPSKGTFTFWHGFLASFAPTTHNLKSFTTGLIRVPLSTAFCHTLYLFLSKEKQE